MPLLNPLFEFGWTFQLFFGSYRSWDHVRIEHIIILSSLLTVVILLYVGIIKRKLENFEEFRKTIPRSSVPFKRDDMSHSMYKLFVEECDRTAKIREIEIEPDLSALGDNGWAAKNDPEYAGAHFKTSIAKSYLTLQEVAMQRRPNLRHRHYRTVRDYVEAIELEFPRIDSELCSKYINCYERARFGPQRLNRKDYEEFMQIVSKMYEVMTEKSSIPFVSFS